MRIGLDIGSTTIKAVVFDDGNNIVFRHYERHCARINELCASLLARIDEQFPNETFQLAISGSAGMGLAEDVGAEFLQEVYATRVALKKMVPDADVAIELGGEDAKILFLTGAGGLEVRMNGSCAGGTGAFIDQMATLMDVPVEDLETLSRAHERTYAIASRCGVFAKSDIQPLLNQGAGKEDIARSIFEAVANQTIAGLAQGRPIAGNVVYLGGPLTFFSQLRDSFDRALNVHGICPDDSLFSVAVGAAEHAEKEVRLPELIARVRTRTGRSSRGSCPALFAGQADYDAFRARHEADSVPVVFEPDYAGNVYIGIDAGFHDDQGRGGRRRSAHPQERISCEQGQSDSRGHRFSDFVLQGVSEGEGRRRGLDRLRRGAGARGVSPGRRRGRDDRALSGREAASARRRLHHRHRWAGHQVLPHSRRRDRRHLSERGVLVRLRFVHPDVCQHVGPARSANLRKRACSRRTRSSSARAARCS